MAKIKFIYASGRIGKLVGVERYGKWYLRSLPVEVKQTAASRKRSTNFGIAAEAGKFLRRQLANSIPYPRNKGMQSRFGGAIVKWIGNNNVGSLPAQQSLPFISGFSFNDKSNSARKWLAALAVTMVDEQALQIQVPAFIPVTAFKAPRGTAAIDCSLVVAYCNLLKPVAATSTVACRLEFPYNDVPVAAQAIPLSLPVVKGCLLVTVACIRFRDAAGQLMDAAAYLPAVVVDARFCSR